MIKSMLKRNELYLFLIIVFYSIIVTSVNPGFLSVENLFDILRTGTGTAILALGVLVALLSGGIDVSFTAVAISGGYIAVRSVMATGIDNLAFAFLVSCSVGITLGMVNGLIISYFRLPTLIATLGTLNVFHGLLTTFVGTESVNAAQMPSCFIEFGSARLIELVNQKGNSYGLSVFVVPLALAILITWVILRRTMLGRGIYALGSNRESAKRAGFNITAIQLFVYSYIGFLAGIMGVVFVSEVRWVNPVTLVGKELIVISAVVIGGAKLTGGFGTILGTLLGVALMVILYNTLVLLGLSSAWNNFFIGIIIIVTVGVTSYRQKNRDKRLLLFKN